VHLRRIRIESKNDDTNESWRVVTSHNVILLASGDIERHTSMGLFPLHIYYRVPGYPTNYPIVYPGNKLPGYGSPIPICFTICTMTTYVMCDIQHFVDVYVIHHLLATVCTSSSAIAEGPRDALSQLKSCQLLHNCTKNHIWLEGFPFHVV